MLDDQLRVAERGIAQAQESLAKTRAALAALQNEKPGALTNALVALACSKAESDVAVSEKSSPPRSASRRCCPELSPPIRPGALSRLLYSTCYLHALLELAGIAAKLEADFKLAESEGELAKAKLPASPRQKRRGQQKSRMSGDRRWRKEKAEKPGVAYTSIHATLKAQEGPDEKATPTCKSIPPPAPAAASPSPAGSPTRATRSPPACSSITSGCATSALRLVPDVSDFGLRCPPPLHQDVLDTLAVDFMEHGWSLKRLHRPLVLSQLYRRSSSTAGAAPHPRRRSR